MRIVGILLAAGKGERFGGDKLLAPLPGGPERGTPRGRSGGTQDGAGVAGDDSHRAP